MGSQNSNNDSNYVQVPCIDAIGA